MKKAFKRTGSVGRPSTRTQITKTKQFSPLQKLRAEKQALKAKLNELKAELKQKLKNARQTAYQNAKRDFETQLTKRTEAKQKIIAAAEAKFEKQFAKLIKKTGKRGRPAKATITATSQHHASSQIVKRGRGRPRKFG